MSNDGLPLKSGLAVIQDHWKLKDHVRLPISLPL